jgi:myo-inositol-1(or 4)-monophosphatase
VSQGPAGQRPPGRGDLDPGPVEPGLVDLAGAPRLPLGVTVAELVGLAERSARQAGQLIEHQRPAGLRVTATKSSPTDVVTQMDHASEALLRDVLLRARPGDGLHGEEGGLRSGGSGLTWVVDPIDGTVNYLYGLPAYVVSVAAVLGDTRVPGGWVSVAGCVHNPASGETWTAGAGLGAFLDGERLVAPQPPPLSAALVATGFGYLSGRRARQARVLATLLPRVRDIRRFGSAAMDVCMVATGRVDAFYERGLHAWDMAASMLVAREAGVVVRGIDGLPPHEHMVVAARQPLVDALAAELQAAGAGADEP